jgi:hypothetical protein
MSFLEVFFSKKLLKSSFNSIQPSGQSMLEMLLIINSRSVVYYGVGAGKTICGLVKVIGILLENPGPLVYEFEPIYKMVRRILIPTLESIVTT